MGKGEVRELTWKKRGVVIFKGGRSKRGQCEEELIRGGSFFTTAPPQWPLWKQFWKS